MQVASLDSRFLMIFFQYWLLLMKKHSSVVLTVTLCDRCWHLSSSVCCVEISRRTNFSIEIEYVLRKQWDVMGIYLPWQIKWLQLAGECIFMIFVTDDVRLESNYYDNVIHCENQCATYNILSARSRHSGRGLPTISDCKVSGHRIASFRRSAFSFSHVDFRSVYSFLLF